MDQYAKLIQQSVAQNNAWSAQQAQNQMDFQERMSNTAHQREVADLKAAGLNPVLSAKLGGASTPSGAMGSTDTGMTSALVDLLQLSMETANSAAGAAFASANTAGKGMFGLDLIRNPRQPWQLAYNYIVGNEQYAKVAEKGVDTLAQSAAKGIMNLVNAVDAKQTAKAVQSIVPAYGFNGRHTKGGQTSSSSKSNIKKWIWRLF